LGSKVFDIKEVVFFEEKVKELWNKIFKRK